MAYKIAVVDDSPADSEYVMRLVGEWADIAGESVKLESFISSEAFLFNYEEHKDFDILLLDVEMGRIDGVSLAKAVRKDNETVQIIFITGYSDYISEGYEVAALHYLIKPVDKKKLFSVLSRAVDRIKKNGKLLNLISHGESVLVPIHQIRYAEVSRNYITIHAKTDITVKMTLSELIDVLDDRFYRVGRSAVVNLNCISRVSKTEILLTDGSKLFLPRGAFEGVNRAIINME